MNIDNIFKLILIILVLSFFWGIGSEFGSEIYYDIKDYFYPIEESISCDNISKINKICESGLKD